MKNLFSYDSKLMRVLSFIADLFILNLVFLLCCLPVFTVGPAQAGLYTAVRILEDPEDDRSCLKAFFRGFCSGFGKISIAWLLFFILDAILVYTLLMAFTYADTGLFIHWAFPLVVLILILLFHSLLPVFHAQFSCTLFQLIRNSWLLLISQPLRAILIGALTWAPAVLFLLAPAFCVRISPLFLTVYYSLCALVGVAVMKKPFTLLIDHFYGADAAIEEKTAD